MAENNTKNSNIKNVDFYYNICLESFQNQFRKSKDIDTKAMFTLVICIFLMIPFMVFLFSTNFNNILYNNKLGSILITLLIIIVSTFVKIFIETLLMFSEKNQLIEFPKIDGDITNAVIRTCSSQLAKATIGQMLNIYTSNNMKINDKKIKNLLIIRVTAMIMLSSMMIFVGLTNIIFK